HLQPTGGLEDNVAPQTSAPIQIDRKPDLKQVHLCLGVPSLPIAHDRRFVVAVLNNLLGGGMSSRLFQNIREKPGLAYLASIEAVAREDVQSLAQEFFRPEQISATVLGPLNGFTLDRNRLSC